MSSPNLSRRQWVFPIVVLATVALVAFAVFWLLDYFVTGGPKVVEPDGALHRYFTFDPGEITDAISSLAGMIAAVLGIVITVVSIIVQLSSERYTGVAQMFLRDRINLAVMAYFVIAAVSGVWVSLSVHDNFVPRAAIIAMMVATTFGLVVMLPYFAYVFRFLEPASIVTRIRKDAIVTVRQGATSGEITKVVASQVPTLVAMEELTDITSNSISGKDKIIASRAVDAIKDFVVEYLSVKDRVHDDWFRIGEGIRDNPDFVAMDPESLRDLEGRRTWVEWKALRQYLGIYNEAQGAMPDINYLVAIDTRYIGEAAAQAGDRELITLVFRFMNSYLRATLNAKAVRTAYNVLNQYRKLVEAMVRAGLHEVAAEAVRHMNYYGRTSYDMGLGFVTETVAYDVGALCELAHHAGKQDEEMLGLFLELDQPLRARKQELGLQGIRKAQVKLACYYLDADEPTRARRIAHDMRNESPERLRSIRDQLEQVESKDFWEIIDRGRNFEYMPPRQRGQMTTFFAWVDEEAALAAAGATSPVATDGA
ncbi:MAG: DUF2254 domain-containing protein [Kofleriaceae bacterium]|nr:DUF2254 domain-containing protein [Myxococcales bacterium]MCB9564009.1 DUF2254 domain-containing protein [Kofleriaceae bacterium]